MKYQRIGEDFVRDTDDHKLKRVPIQIASNYNVIRGYFQLFVLCNDGTIWTKIPGNSWSKTEDIPQD